MGIGKDQFPNGGIPMKSLKAWWAFGVAVLTDTATLVADNNISVNDWITMISITSAAVGVYLLPNLKNGENVQKLADEAIGNRAAAAKRFQ